MSQVIHLANYKRKSRQAYLAKHGQRLDRFVERFVSERIDFDFRQLAQDYQAGHYGNAQDSWDYVHFREILADALNEVFGTLLYKLLLAQSWFDDRLITRDEIIDRCLSTYIMSHCEYAITSF